ncbi:MAG: hypothetical protein NTX57_19035 [Armatimonadetes bacterium]|nr:hypothetical protein [Armatimonadota bacterium]
MQIRLLLEIGGLTWAGPQSQGKPLAEEGKVLPEKKEKAEAPAHRMKK